MPQRKPAVTADAERSRSARIAEYFVLSAPLAAALAFGVVEPWARAAWVVFAFVPALLLRFPFDACSGAFFAFGAVAVAQSIVTLDPNGPARAFGSVVPGASADNAAAWFAAAFLSSSAAALRSRDSSFTRRLAVALAASSVTVAVVGFIQISDGNTAIYGMRVVMSGVTPFAGFYNRNHAAAFLGTGALMAFALWTTMRRTGSPLDHRAKQATWLVPVALIWAAMWSTESRGALVAHAATLALFIGLPLWGFAAAAALLGWAASRNSSLPIRMDIYAATASAVLDRPFAGWGAGAFPSVSPSFIPGKIGFVSHAHSSFLDAAFEFGLPLACAGAALAIPRAFHVLRAKDPIERAFAAAAAFSLLHAVIESTLFAGANLAMLALCLSACAPSRPFHSWARLAAPAAALFAFAAAWDGARDSFSRLTRAAYFSNSPLADDYLKPGEPREMIRKYDDARRSPWDWKLSAVRRAALFALSRGGDSELFADRLRSQRGS